MNYSKKVLLIFQIAFFLSKLLIAQTPPQQNGWPFIVPGDWGTPYYSVIGNMNNDPDNRMEVVFGMFGQGGENSLVYALSHTGEILEGWPVIIDAWPTYCALADLNNDSILEIISVTMYGTIQAWFLDGSEYWKINGVTNFRPVSGIHVADLNNDGQIEIVVAISDYPNYYQKTLYVINSDGTNFSSNWPLEFTGTSNVGINIALADMDGDGDIEIIARESNFLNIFHHDGTSMASWPFICDKVIYSELSIGDINNDGMLEIVFGTTDPGQIFVIDRYANILSGWPQSAPMNPKFAALGDIDSDNQMEIIYGGSGNILYAFNFDGTTLEGWPFISGTGTSEYFSGCVIGDIDGDSIPDIVANGTTGIYFIDGSGAEIIPSIPHWCGSNPAMLDIDNDGDIEILTCGGSSGDYQEVYMWDLESPYNDKSIHWQMLQSDKHNTGVTSFEYDSTYVSTSEPLMDITKKIEISNYPNPFKEKTDIHFSIPKSTHVRINVVDIHGYEIKVLVDKRLEAGHHQVIWNTCEFEHGIYICNLRTIEKEVSIKLILHE